MSPDPELERLYNNLAMVPEHPAIIAGWRRDAAAWRDAAPLAELAVAYGPGEREKLDLFWPDASRAAPIALFIHGGYWQAMDRSAFSHCARGLNGCGVAVAVPSYDLCPAVSVAKIVAQMREACAFLRYRHRRRLLACGHSAGGQLAAMLLASAHVEAAVPISGVFDLTPLLHTTIGAALRLTPLGARDVSPRFLPPPGLPLHAVVGGAESVAFLAQTREFAAAWGGTWEALPGLHHFSVLAPLLEAGSALVGRIARLAEFR